MKSQNSVSREIKILAKINKKGDFKQKFQASFLCTQYFLLLMTAFAYFYRYLIFFAVFILFIYPFLLFLDQNIYCQKFLPG